MSAPPLSPFIAKMVILAASLVMIAIRAPHGQRSRSIKVVEHRRGRLEVALLGLAMLGFFVPFIWMMSPAFSFADYPLRPIPLALGIALLAAGLWLFHRSHVDLGTNWSVTLELRENHRLVTQGVYRHVRHPMYAALLLYSVGQALALPNWLAGLSYLVPFTLLLAGRLGAEERMMLDEFGDEYAAYMRTTKRLVPGAW